MMKKKMIVPLTMLMATAILTGSYNISYADAVDVPSYLAMGADLKEGEKQKVYDLLDIKESNLDAYNVVKITNADEHEYLDDYLSKSVIGTRALSCVMIQKSDEGEGIEVTTKNITYCTEGMYKNALTTAGIEDAQVTVVGPYNISGTAALVGAMKAYEKMTGEVISEEAKDTATNELVVSGELADELGDSDKAEQFLAYLKEKVAETDLSSDTDVEGIITEGAKEFGISLNEDQKDQLSELMKKIDKLDLNVEDLKKQASDIYDKISQMDIDAQGTIDKIIAFFQSIVDWFSK